MNSQPASVALVGLHAGHEDLLRILMAAPSNMRPLGRDPHFVVRIIHADGGSGVRWAQRQSDSALPIGLCYGIDVLKTLGAFKMSAIARVAAAHWQPHPAAHFAAPGCWA